MRRTLCAWTRFWFAPSDPLDLAACRVCFYLGLLAFYLPVDFTQWGHVSQAFWTPMPIFRLLHLRPLSPHALSALAAIWRLSLVLSAIGWLTAASTLTAALLGFYLLGLPHNFGHVYHFDSLLVLTLVIMASARTGDAWSVDAMLAPRTSSLHASAEYTWPRRLVWVLMALVFFAAGVAKLRHGGLAWIASPNMSMVLMRAAYHTSDADPITPIGLWVASHDWLSRVVAAFAVATEIGFIVVLFSRRARIFFVPAAAALLIGIRVMMGPTFGGFLILNVFWIPWSAMVPALARRLRRSHSWEGERAALRTASSRT